MENMPFEEKTKKEKIILIALLALGVLFFALLLGTIIGSIQPKTFQTTYSELINKNEIARLSVSEFVYNGIARKYKENGEHDYNVMYKSTVKAGVNADGIEYAVDEEKKIVTFIFPEVEIQRPVIDENSIKFIPDKDDLITREIIAFCRDDAHEKVLKSDKLIVSAQDNLKSIMEAWYTPVFEGYTFEYLFASAEGGVAE